MLAGDLALAAASLFTGAAVYINIAEHPARSELDDHALLTQWRQSYRRALPMQAGLAIAGGVAGLIAWWQTADWRWLAGALVLLANWPYTMIGIMPTNKALLSLPPDAAGANSRILMRRWGMLHAMRSALGGLAVLLFLWAHR